MICYARRPEKSKAEKSADLYREEADRATRLLCSVCKTIDIADMSEDLAKWCKEHQKLDAKRAKKAAKNIALRKLNDADKKALGLVK